MKRRWWLGCLGGAVGAQAVGALVTSLAPGTPLDGIALGLLVSLLAWVAIWVWVMGTQKVGRAAGILLCITVLSTALCVWKVWG